MSSLKPSRSRTETAVRVLARSGEYLYGGVNAMVPHLTGAVDIMVVVQPDGSLQCSPFYVRFGKTLTSRQREVTIDVNGQRVDFTMHLGSLGQAYFVLEEEDAARDEMCEEDDEVDLAGIMSPPSGYSSGDEQLSTVPLAEGLASSLQASVFSAGSSGSSPRRPRHAPPSALGRERFAAAPEPSPPSELQPTPVRRRPPRAAAAGKGKAVSFAAAAADANCRGNGMPAPAAADALASDSQPSSRMLHAAWSLPELPRRQEPAAAADPQCPAELALPAGRAYSLPEPSLSPHDSSWIHSLAAEGVELRSAHALTSHPLPPHTLSPGGEAGSPPLLADPGPTAAGLRLAPVDTPFLRLQKPPPGAAEEGCSADTVDGSAGLACWGPSSAALSPPPQPRASLRGALHDSGSLGRISPSGGSAAAVGEAPIADSPTPDAGQHPAVQMGETFELSLCLSQLTPGMSAGEVQEVFDAGKLSVDQWRCNGPELLKDPELACRIDSEVYSCQEALPWVLGVLAFGAPPLPAPAAVAAGPGGELGETQPVKSGWTLFRFWSSAKPEPSSEPAGSAEGELGGAASLAVPMQPAAVSVASEQGLPGLGESPAAAGSRREPTRMKKVIKSWKPSSLSLASLKPLLLPGQNTVVFSAGGKQLTAFMYVLPWTARIVISDIDGTITKSDILGHALPMLGVSDWSHSGIAELFTAIARNGYSMMFLSSRAIAQASITRDYLLTINQNGHTIPPGPVIISPHGLLPSLYREMILRRPHEFKIATLQEIRRLFPEGINPFFAGFGNRDTDEISYKEVGVPQHRIFTINPKGQVRKFASTVQSSAWSSLCALSTLSDSLFPPIPVDTPASAHPSAAWPSPPCGSPGAPPVTPDAAAPLATSPSCGSAAGSPAAAASFQATSATPAAPRVEAGASVGSQVSHVALDSETNAVESTSPVAGATQAAAAGTGPPLQPSALEEYNDVRFWRVDAFGFAAALEAAGAGACGAAAPGGRAHRRQASVVSEDEEQEEVFMSPYLPLEV